MQDPSLWPAAVDEICRYHTASSYALRRVALEDVKVGDTTIKYVFCQCAKLDIVWQTTCLDTLNLKPSHSPMLLN